MKIKFLGTAAAEGVPAVFCNCNTCKRAKAVGGREIRTRSQILIDDDTLFDFPMDTYMHMLTYRLDLSKIKRVLITHAHMDHCYPQEFCMRGGPFAHDMTEPDVFVYCNATVKAMFLSDTAREIRQSIADNIKINVLHPYDEIKSGDMRIIALPAAHTIGEECLVYYVERNGVGALLLNDSGVLDESVYVKLKEKNVNIRIAALDCTYGAIKHGPGRHMGLFDVAEQKSIMQKLGLIDENTEFFATHLSHNNDLSHDEISVVAERYGIKVAYDGCEIKI